MHPDLGVGDAKSANVHALRGRLTHTELRRAGLELGDVPLGDPGYLAPSLLGIDPAPEPDRLVGLVCHYTDRDRPAMRRMMKEPGVRDLNVLGPPEELIRAMAGCSAVISSSLHGLVFAEAMGIPSLWVQAGEDVGGGEFKFHDWFSTTCRPQLNPRVLEGGETAEALAGQAELRESEIDVCALVNAFPTGRLDELEERRGAVFPVATCRTRPTPVFLISFDRGPQLRRAIESVRGLDAPTDPVVHDNGSTDPTTLELLEELEGEGARVFRRPAITGVDELNSVNDTVQSYFEMWAEPSTYVVTDCDIDISIADPRALDLYEELLNKLRHVECVGPMLRIRDIPSDYPLFNRAMNRHIEQFWRHTPTFEQTSYGPVAVLETGIDTTFALHRAGSPFRRLKDGLRVYEPFEALHLDWYQLHDDSYTESSSSEISHWNNVAEHDRWRDEPLRYSEFYSVRLGSSGEPEICKERLR